MRPKFSIYLIIMGWQLIQKLFNSVFLSRAVNIRDLLLWQAGEIQLDLTGRNTEFSLRDTHHPSTASSFSYCFISGLIEEGRKLRYIRPLTGFVLKIRDPDEPAQQT